MAELLVFHETDGFRHDIASNGQSFGGIDGGLSYFAELSQSHGFTHIETQDSTIFNDADLAQFEAVVFLSTIGNPLSASEMAAFQRFIQAGGGFVGIHIASLTHVDDSWFRGLVGAVFDSKPPSLLNVTLRTHNPNHPASANLPAEWVNVRGDEIYNWNITQYPNNDPRNLNILLDVDESSYSDPNQPGWNPHPLAWYQVFDGGRSFYTSLGHDNEGFESDPNLRSHLEGGTLWAMGRAEISGGGSMTTFQEPFLWSGSHAASINGGQGATVWWDEDDWDVRLHFDNNMLSNLSSGHHVDIHKALNPSPRDGRVDNNVFIPGGDGSPGVGVMHVDFEAIISARLRNPLLIGIPGEPATVRFFAPRSVTTGHWWEAAIAPTREVISAGWSPVPAVDDTFFGKPGPGKRPPMDAFNIIAIGSSDVPDDSAWTTQIGLVQSEGGNVGEVGSLLSIESAPPFIPPSNPPEGDTLFEYVIRFYPDRIELETDQDGDGIRETVHSWNVTIPWAEVYLSLLGVAYQANHHPQAGSGFQGQVRELKWREFSAGPLRYARTVCVPKKIGTTHHPRLLNAMSFDDRDNQRTGFVNGLPQPNTGSYSRWTSHLVCNLSHFSCNDGSSSHDMILPLDASDLDQISRAQLVYRTRNHPDNPSILGSASLVVNGVSQGALRMAHTDLLDGPPIGRQLIQHPTRSVDIDPSLLQVGSNAISIIGITNCSFDNFQLELSLNSTISLPVNIFGISNNYDPNGPSITWNFDANVTGDLAQVDWDFGDGTIVSDGGISVSHRYDQPGRYRVVASVFGLDGSSDQEFIDLIVYVPVPAPPNGISRLIEIDTDPIEIQSPDLSGSIVLPVESQIDLAQITIRPSVSAPTPPEGLQVLRGLEILEYDGLGQPSPSILPGPGKLIKVKYSQADILLAGGETNLVMGRFSPPDWSLATTTRNPGTMTASVETGEVSGWYLLAQTSILPELPIAKFDIVGVSGQPLGIQLVNQSINATSFEWDLGDGTISKEIAPVHVYQKSGSYTITLRATNSFGTVAAFVEVTISTGDNGTFIVIGSIGALAILGVSLVNR